MEINKVREIRRVKQLISSKKGYYNNGRLKKSYSFLAEMFNTTEEVVMEAVKSLRKNIIPPLDNRPIKITTIKNLDDLERKSESWSNDFPTIDIPGTYWVTGCVHAPFHNKNMYESTLNFLAKEVKLEGVILNGDILDMHSISRHNKGLVNYPGITLDYEYKEGAKFIDEVDSMLRQNNSKYSSKHYMYGNHEMWHSIALKEVNNSKYGNALKSPLEALDLINRGYTVQTDYKTAHINFGKFLEINHGEFVNVHSAKKTIDTYRKSVLYNHTHRFQIYMEGHVGGFNIGWGGDDSCVVFNYATRAMKNSWVNASAIVTLEKDSSFHVQPLLFINNKLIVNGRTY